MSEALTGQVVTFGRVLREAGLPVGPGRVADALRGLDLVDIAARDDVYWTLRTTLTSCHEDLAVFDHVKRRLKLHLTRRGFRLANCTKCRLHSATRRSV